MDWNAYFENFPRRALALAPTRRELLAAVASELNAYSGRVDGRSSFRLVDLGLLPDDLLGELAPGLDRSIRTWEQEDGIWAQPGWAVDALTLIPAEKPAQSVFRRMDGRQTLADIAANLAVELDWPQARAFAYVRGVFLHLVTCRVCAPLNRCD